jgi:uncharacterized protein YndB with AHSA1/START domain
MTHRDDFPLGPADNARVEKDGEHWVLVLRRELRHGPECVWEALTDPAQLREWAPFDADGPLDVAGNRVRLTTAGRPMLHVSETTIERAERPHLLVYQWGGNAMRWELAPTPSGTTLTLWTSIDRPYIAMGAAGWHLCFAVLDRWLSGTPVGRIVGGDAMAFAEWRRLQEEYSRQFSG